MSGNIINDKIFDDEVFDAFFNSMPGPVFITDSKLNLIKTNTKASLIFDIQTSAKTLLEATFSAELVNEVKKYIEKKETSQSEIKIFKNAKQYNFEVSITLLKNQYLIIVLIDITRIKKLEKVRKDFAANVSHELRTPIQLIKGFSETILDQKPDPDKVIHAIEIIHKNALIMENLTSDLLTLVSLEEDNESNSRLEMKETNVLSLLEEAIQAVEPKRNEKKINIKLFCDKQLSFNLYGPFIIQALINLLDNAIKYSPKSSKVEVSAEIKEIPGALTAQTSGKLIIKIKDNGIGIPAEFQERVFERFFRVDKSRARDTGSTGLGLAIVRHIALLHNGSVELVSHRNEGTCFIINIPA